MATNKKERRFANINKSSELQKLKVINQSVNQSSELQIKPSEFRPKSKSKSRPSKVSKSLKSSL